MVNINQTTEVIQFVLALIFLIGILAGSYWFVYAPVKRENDERIRNERENSSKTQSR
ncbi:hypothetical protein [Rubrobacter indicoceani]|uniref:hypothetical protein n=1 Tax=Rubrobacter indicoceani TaxID=2051957 RepID=UPI0013C4E4F1|nr:hypothetical protein [Rubrobacter indicoceani]